MSDNCATFDFEFDREWCEQKPSELGWNAKHASRSLAKQWAAEIDSLQKHRVDVLVLETSETFERRFHEQADKWSHETQHLSSPTQMMMHPSYQAILGMAQEDQAHTLSLMLRDLRDNRRPWFWALSYLTKDNPIRQSDAGKLDRMIQAWIDWGKQKGIL